MYNYLDKVNTPDDLKALNQAELPLLCDDIREFLIDNVSRTGGHLASNLGVVELSVALHRVFDSPKDHIIFDVGHQCYVHKILTGRKEQFNLLRTPGGLSGFTAMRESAHDPFGAGHSSTSLSAALGFAEADRLSGSDSHTVAVIGDGAYTGGMIHEAINNCKPDLKLIVVLNENGMSISANKGAFASYLSRFRASQGYVSMKKRTDSFLSRIPLIGKPIRVALSWVKNAVKSIIFSPSYFEQLGFYYIGPIDGNDVAKVERALAEAKQLGKCVFVHIKTRKGKGSVEAETRPERFHSVNGEPGAEKTFHSVFAEELIKLAENDDKVTAVTAAMGVGTGLTSFEETYPDRYFDVGIAEEHALTFSAGLAASGYKPYTAIYSTFLQRGYDNIVHDIALQKLPVKMIIDRAGIAVHDGATHHGIFDVAFLSHIPEMEIIAPATFDSLRLAIRYANDVDHPIAIRYPNDTECEAVKAAFFGAIDPDMRDYRCDFDPDTAPRKIIVTYGALADRVLRAKELLANDGIEVGVILLERIKPYRVVADFIDSIKPDYVLFAEEGIKNGGAAMILGSMLRNVGRYDIAAIDDDFLIPQSPTDIYDFAGLSEEKIAQYFRGTDDGR